MSTPRRHPQVVHLDEVDPITNEKGSRFGATMKWLGHATGSRGIGCTWYEVPPGKTAFPQHYHCANEESVYVLEGAGTVRIGAETVAVGPGDYVTFPVGPAHAHQVINTGTGPLRYLCFSTKHPVEVVGYPESGKLGAMALAPGSTFKDPPWVRAIFEQSGQVDYYKGEKTD
jgi:uncharacterized cupin superfamily protein